MGVNIQNGESGQTENHREGTANKMGGGWELVCTPHRAAFPDRGHIDCRPRPSTLSTSDSAHSGLEWHPLAEDAAIKMNKTQRERRVQRVPVSANKYHKIRSSLRTEDALRYPLHRKQRMEGRGRGYTVVRYTSSRSTVEIAGVNGG